MNMLSQDIKDMRLIDLIKKYLKSGVMENGIVMRTDEGSPQGGNLSPLLANIDLDKFDKEFEGRGVKVEDLKKLGMPEWQAYRNGNTRKGYWVVAGSGILTHTITNKRLAYRGYYDISEAYKSLHYL